MLVKKEKRKKRGIFKEWIWCNFELALIAALYWNDTLTFPRGKVAVRGTSLWWEEETGVFCLAGIEELHFSPLQHLQLLGWLCDLQRHHAWCWWDTEQACTSSPVTAQLITQLPLHLSFCFLLACSYCPELISTSSVTKIRLFSFGLLITFMGVVNTKISKGLVKVLCTLS